MMRVLKPLQDKATTGAGKRLVLPEPRRVRFLIRGEGSVSAGAVTIECCPESTKAGKFLDGVGNHSRVCRQWSGAILH